MVWKITHNLDAMFHQIYHGISLEPGGWQKITLSFIPNKDYSQLWIYPRQTIYHYHSSEFTVDDISITESNITALNGNAVCYSRNYSFSLPNFPNNTSITWTHSSNLTYISGQGTTLFKVKAKNNSISANGCSITLIKQIWIGKPNFTITGDYDLPTGLMGIAEINYTHSQMQGITDITWNKSGAISSISGGPVIARYRAGTRPSSGTVDLTLTNQCGSTFKYFIVRVTGGWHKAYPNPTNDILTIDFNKNDMPENIKAEPIEIRLYDKMMCMVKKKTFSGNSTTFNVGDLQKDVYVLHIIIADKIFEEKKTQKPLQARSYR